MWSGAFEHYFDDCITPAFQGRLFNYKILAVPPKITIIAGSHEKPAHTLDCCVYGPNWARYIKRSKRCTMSGKKTSYSNIFTPSIEGCDKPAASRTVLSWTTSGAFVDVHVS